MNKLLIILSFFMVSCKNGIKFTALNKQRETGVHDRDDERKGKKYYYQSVLVSNLPAENKTLKSLLLNYHEKNIDSVFQDKKVITFSTTFYIENSKTSYFIKNPEDPGGFSSEILIDYYDEFGIAEIITKRIGNASQLKTEITFTDK
ncbi:hypothetical protein [Flavobacterium piscis]|uniref:DUF4163 domain-containing protein n=1 Tax=Flavobacterium piscis TaxID=1114874 RepID=A0ABU1YB46_9FLAO|nr:hypothetical protein [Flavobacterium piscis]MDR7211461.1 hypothetical protein [Flavobacterium piscis]